MIVINCRKTLETDKTEWFASLGSKRLTDFYEKEQDLKDYMHTLSFTFTLCTAIAEDMYDYKRKEDQRLFEHDFQEYQKKYQNHTLQQQFQTLNQNKEITSYQDWLDAHTKPNQ